MSSSINALRSFLLLLCVVFLHACFSHGTMMTAYISFRGSLQEDEKAEREQIVKEEAARERIEEEEEEKEQEEEEEEEEEVMEGKELVDKETKEEGSAEGDYKNGCDCSSAESLWGGVGGLIGAIIGCVSTGVISAVIAMVFVYRIKHQQPKSQKTQPVVYREPSHSPSEQSAKSEVSEETDEQDQQPEEINVELTQSLKSNVSDEPDELQQLPETDVELATNRAYTLSKFFTENQLPTPPVSIIES